MTKQAAESTEQQKQAVPAQQRSPSVRTSGLDPLGYSLIPSEFLLMNPFALMRRMTEEMDRVLKEPFNKGDAVWSPVVEVTEREGNYVVRAELPGLKPENVKAEVIDGALVLEGERKFEHDENQGGVHRTERRYGRFYRRIPLPEGANVEQTRAKFENGVLEVAVPVQNQQNNRREIPIQADSTSSESASGKKA